MPVGLSSVGAGALGATLILLLNPRLPARREIGIVIAHAVLLTLLAGIGEARLGHVDWTLLIGSLSCIWLGAQLGKSLSKGLVRALLHLTGHRRPPAYPSTA